MVENTLYKVPFLSLSYKQKEAEHYSHLIKDFMMRGKILNSPEIDDFERDFASYCHSKHAVGVSSGTAALYMSMKALGISQGPQSVISTSGEIL